MIWVSSCKCDDCDSVPCNENYESGGGSDKESFEGMFNMIWVSSCKCDDCGSVPCDENYESDGDSLSESLEGAV